MDNEDTFVLITRQDFGVTAVGINGEKFISKYPVD